MKNELLSALFNLPSSLAALPSECKRMARARIKTLHLKRQQVVCLKREQQFKKILVRSGVLWLTGTPAINDVILGQGQTFKFQNDWPYVIEAIDDTEISLL